MKKFLKFLVVFSAIFAALYVIKKHFFDLCEEEDWDIPEEPEDFEEEETE